MQNLWTVSNMNQLNSSAYKMMFRIVLMKNIFITTTDDIKDTDEMLNDTDDKLHTDNVKLPDVEVTNAGSAAERGKLISI